MNRRTFRIINALFWITVWVVTVMLFSVVIWTLNVVYDEVVSVKASAFSVVICLVVVTVIVFWVVKVKHDDEVVMLQRVLVVKAMPCDAVVISLVICHGEAVVISCDPLNVILTCFCHGAVS